LANLFGGELLEEASVEVACVVDEDVNLAELPHRSIHRALCVLGTGYVELEG
jgi:hypothetical protein